MIVLKISKMPKIAKHSIICGFFLSKTSPLILLLISLSNLSVELERVDEDDDCIYLCGQSLGLKPKATDEYCLEVLNTWARKGVHAHFTGSLPAALCDIPAKNPMAKLVGALPSEVTVMNGLTVNLHLLLASFYRPTAHRYKIMIEDHAFPSDIVRKRQNVF